MTTTWATNPILSDAGEPVRLRILIVEDNLDNALSLAMLLRLRGHDIRIAASGTDAIHAVQYSTPDVVLLDIGLPGMNGYDLARHLAKERRRRIPLLIAVTGYGQEEDRRRSAEAGIDIHLLKPVDPKELETLLYRFHGHIRSLEDEEP